jgi:outer membrane protein TolC
VPALEAELATTQHRLAVLTGLAPEAAPVSLTASQPLPALPPPIDPGTPGDLLARRPDVAAAQSRLAAATARVGVARADFFPRFTLGGLFGSQAIGTGGLFERDAEHRIVALGIDWSFLDFGRVRAHLDSAHAEADGEVARYEQTVLRALQETEDALVRLDRARLEDAELQSAAGDSANAARLARIRYEAGAADLFEVLDAERVNLQAQDAAVQVRTRGLVDVVDLYGAMAGGWPAKLPSALAKTGAVAGK